MIAGHYGFWRTAQKPKGWAILAVFMGSVALAGCETAGYLGQSVAGHLDLVSRQRPIDAVLSDPATSPSLQARLVSAQAMLAFAHDELALPDNGSYRSYADLQRPFVTWTVVVTPVLGLAPHTWCYPVAGCVAYRGYFAQSDAVEFASGFKPEEFDTHVGGATAYSTLGWFSDPLLNTMMARGDAALAAVIFHELAHQRLYLTGDTTFNESYAVAVERFGLRRWFEHSGKAQWLSRLDARDERDRAFRRLVIETREKLSSLYQSSRAVEEKLLAKTEIFEEMRAGHRRLRASWGGESPYDHWFKAPINNARLALVSTYGEHVGAFLRLYQQVGQDPSAFHRASEELARQPPEERRRRLSELSGAS